MDVIPTILLTLMKNSYNSQNPMFDDTRIYITLL